MPLLEAVGEVEQLVTVPTEADLLNGTKGVSVLRSESVDGLSSIVLLFEPGTVVKFSRDPGARLELSPDASLLWMAAPYRPVILILRLPGDRRFSRPSS